VGRLGSHLVTGAGVGKRYRTTPWQCHPRDTCVHTKARNHTTSSPSTRGKDLHEHKYDRAIRDIVTQGTVLEQKLKTLLDDLTQIRSDPDEMEWENTNTTYLVPDQPPFWKDVTFAKIPTGPLSEYSMSGLSSLCSDSNTLRGLPNAEQPSNIKPPSGSSIGLNQALRYGMPVALRWKNPSCLSSQ